FAGDREQCIDRKGIWSCHGFILSGCGRHSSIDGRTRRWAGSCDPTHQCEVIDDEVADQQA
ncbi:MAG: hypothetical protein EBS76_10940, partial [Actinobacteria bacterium]|nr:hypothetical protein [Actinomycetota bacterium]